MLNVTMHSKGMLAEVYALKQPLPSHPEVVITTLPLHKCSHAGPGNNLRGASSSAILSELIRLPAPGEENMSPLSQDKGKGKALALKVYQKPTHPYTSVSDATHRI